MEQSREILKKYCLCDSCLGRQFGMLSKGLTNKERGRSIKISLLLDVSYQLSQELPSEEKEKYSNFLIDLYKNGLLAEAATTAQKLGISFNILKSERKKCFICDDIFSKIDEIIDQIANSTKNIEFDTFLIGSRLLLGVIEREDSLRATFNILSGETIKAEFNRRIGKRFTQLTKKNVDFDKPDVVIVLDLTSGLLELVVTSNALFIYGRYQKLIRGIPQTTWFCSQCNGEGCEECNFTGRRYQTSVQEIISTPILELTGGVDAKFHGAGREDIDALMTGNGRPFVIEIKEPKIRHLDLEKLTQKVNIHGKDKIIVSDLEFSNKDVVRKIKAMAQVTKKTYRAHIKIGREIKEGDNLKLEQELNNVKIKQWTPTRVQHRRANKIRIKNVIKFKCQTVAPDELTCTIECQGGTYIKELINGDNGRTTPSVASILQTEAKCINLDVINIEEFGSIPV